RNVGVGPDVLVGIHIERSLEMLVCVLGVLKAGGAYVPLDPAYPRERLEFMLKDCGAKALLVQPGLVDGFKFEIANLKVIPLAVEKPEVLKQAVDGFSLSTAEGERAGVRGAVPATNPA